MKGEGRDDGAPSLLGENARLRARVAVLESEQTATRGQSLKAAEARALWDAMAALRSEKEDLETQLTTARQEIDRMASHRVTLEGKLRAAQEESRRYSNDYLQVEAQNTNLANLYVASYRLHGTLDREELCLALQEIVANLIGSEEMGVFETGPDGRSLRLVTSFGIEPTRYSRLQVGEGPIGRAAQSGEVFVNEGGGPVEDEDSLTACVPLLLAGRPVGVIAIFRLLSHKPSLQEQDRELFEFLAGQAAVALLSTRLHALHGGAAA